MKYSFILFAVLVTLTPGCEKNKFTTEPQVEVKSINPKTVFQGDIIEFRSKFTDKEGDVDSALIVYKWYNGAAVVEVDTFRYPFDALNLPPRTKEGDIFIEFAYAQQVDPYLQLGAVTRDTNSAFGLILLDKAKHRSAYVETEQIRLKKP
jgi:hypothetical protein